MTGFKTASENVLSIKLTEGISDEWSYNKGTGCVTIFNCNPYHEYTVAFLTYLIWDPVHMYNAVVNDWKDFEHQITFDVRQPKTHKYTMERLRKFITDHPYVNVIINVGDGDTAHTGGYEWGDAMITSTVRGFVHNGGGFIGVGEPTGHQFQGHYLQLANVMGVEKETGFTLVYDKYNWEQNPNHFILQDVLREPDFGEGKKNICALPDTQILIQKDNEIQIAVNEFGSGRSVYISGLPYSFENSRVLYRAILWATHSEKELKKWYSTNYNVDVHAFLENNKYCVVNNTYEPQDMFLALLAPFFPNPVADISYKFIPCFFFSQPHALVVVTFQFITMVAY